MPGLVGKTNYARHVASSARPDPGTVPGNKKARPRARPLIEWPLAGPKSAALRAMGHPGYHEPVPHFCLLSSHRPPFEAGFPRVISILLFTSRLSFGLIRLRGQTARHALAAGPNTTRFSAVHLVSDPAFSNRAGLVHPRQRGVLPRHPAEGEEPGGDYRAHGR